MKPAGKKRRSIPLEKLNWAKLYQAVGLDSDEQAERLARVLVVHLLVDRLVTFVLAAKLAASSQSKGRPDVQKAIYHCMRDVAALSIPTRVNLAAILGLITPTAKESFLEINRVRNSLVHFKPKASTWDVGAVEEIASQAAFERCTQKGIKALRALISVLSM